MSWVVDCLSLVYKWLMNTSWTIEMLSWQFFGTALLHIGLGKLLAFGVVPVLVPPGPRLWLGVFLLEELVAAVEVSMLAMAAGAPLVGVWVEGWAWVRLEAAVVAGGLVVVVALGVVVGLVSPAIAALG